ncbi:hypothetical protein CEQ23_01740 [Burkholderia cepacia]|uniref:Uncharacterized protein n=1 Tax=Burkholderia cepacia TaxID=292 RepID=A0ABM6NYA5_BURCE|nr:hypothetical protein CEQ23_01740 [Burkholderia cepacia]ATF79696.1 hypothetical protein CO711_19710 [Burkholderia cepacia]QCY08898.1 hypothetical protein EJ998_38730 [Burkholderia cepacia ATCC 25416]
MGTSCVRIDIVYGTQFCSGSVPCATGFTLTITRQDLATVDARARSAPLGPVHANNGLALAPRRAERKDCDEANTRRIREEHDAAIGPSGGQPHERIFLNRGTCLSAHIAASCVACLARPNGAPYSLHCERKGTFASPLLA